MDLNKVAAGLFAAGIVFVGSLFVSESVFAPDKLKQQAYIIDTGVVQTAEASDESKPQYLTGAEFATLVDKADIKKGEALFKKCTACHDISKGGPHKVGPNIWNIVESPVASRAGYTYSDALKAVGGNWSIEALNGWLFNPRSFAKGNRMGFIGLKNDQERANLIAYLKTVH